MVTENKRMQQRRRTVTQIESENPTLAVGEIGVATGDQIPRFKIGDGATAWNSLIGPVAQAPYIFWQHGDDVTIPTGVWTPLPWNVTRTSKGDWDDYTAASTTVAAGSNGAALPQGTINVASTSGFASAGFLIINIGGTDRVVRYTGTSGGNQFTGGTLGVGTMTTGDAVAQARVVVRFPLNCIVNAVTEVKWASNATGVRGIRFHQIDPTFGELFILGHTVTGAVAATDPLLHIQAVEQPGGIVASNSGFFVEAYQSSGGPLDSVEDSNDFSAPRIVAYAVSSYTP